MSIESTQVVWKYELQPGFTTLSLPPLARPIAAAFQGETLFVWALIWREFTTGEYESEKRKRNFIVVGTGHHIASNAQLVHVATCLRPDGLVFHVFEDPSS